MRPALRRVLIVIAVVLPAVLVYTARQVSTPDPAATPAAELPPVFVGRVTPAQSHWSVGRPLRVTVEIRADRQVELAGIRVWADEGQPDEIAPFTVDVEPRTVTFEVVFAARGDHPLVLQVRLAADTPWSSLPPTAEVIVA